MEPIPAKPAEPVKPAPAPAKGGSRQERRRQEAPWQTVEAAKIEAGEASKPPQPRSQRIDLRFDMVVPGVEQPGQAGGLILRPTANEPGRK